MVQGADFYFERLLDTGSDLANVSRKGLSPRLDLLLLGRRQFGRIPFAWAVV